MSFSISFIFSLQRSMQSWAKWPIFSQLKHLASVEFGVAALINRLEVAEVVYAKVVIEVRFRVTAGTEVFVVGADVNVLVVIAAVVCVLLRSNCSLYKRFKSPLALSVRLQKS